MNKVLENLISGYYLKFLFNSINTKIFIFKIDAFFVEFFIEKVSIYDLRFANVKNSHL